jgi:hypothetical protein
MKRARTKNRSPLEVFSPFARTAGRGRKIAVVRRADLRVFNLLYDNDLCNVIQQILGWQGII